MCVLTIKNEEDISCPRMTVKSMGQQKDTEGSNVTCFPIGYLYNSLIYLNPLAPVDIEQDRNRIDGKCSN